MDKSSLKSFLVGICIGAGIGFGFFKLTSSSAPTVASNTKPEPAAAKPAPPLGPEQMKSLPNGHPSLTGDDPKASADPAAATAAVDNAKRAANADIGNFLAQMDAAATLYQAKKYEEAIEFLNRARVLRPDSADTLIALGVTSSELGKFDEAAVWLRKALSLNENDAETRTELALVFMKKKDFPTALAEAERTLKTTPNQERALEIVARAAIELKNTAKAEEAIKRLSALNPGNPGIASLNQLLSRGKTS